MAVRKLTRIRVRTEAAVITSVATKKPKTGRCQPPLDSGPKLQSPAAQTVSIAYIPGNQILANRRAPCAPYFRTNAVTEWSGVFIVRVLYPNARSMKPFCPEPNLHPCIHNQSVVLFCGNSAPPRAFQLRLLAQIEIRPWCNVMPVDLTFFTPCQLPLIILTEELCGSRSCVC